MKIRSRLGEVEVISSEEEKMVAYSLLENGKDLKRTTDVQLEGYQKLLDEHLDKFNEIYRKDNLTLEDAKVMYDILDKIYTMHEYNDNSLGGGYTFYVNEIVKKYSFKEKVDW